MPNQDWWLIFKTKKEGNAPKELSNDLKEVKKGLAGAVEGLTGMSLAGLGVAGVIAGVGAGLRASVGAAMEAETIQADLAATLKSTHGAAGLTADEINRMATEFSNLTGIEDDSIVKSQALLLTFTSIGKDVFPDATEAILNMSSKMGGMESATIQIGKALNVTAGDTTAATTAMSALRRVGVAFTEEQVEMGKQLVKTGDVVGYQKLILGELKTEFGGLAAAMGDTTQGKINKAKVAFGNLGETIGGILLPALGDGADAVTVLIKDLDRLIRITDEVKSKSLATSRTYGEYTQSVVNNTQEQMKNNDALMVLSGIFPQLTPLIFATTVKADELSEVEFNVAQGMYDIQDEGTRMAAAMSSGVKPAVDDLAQSEADLKAEQDRLKSALSDLKDLVAGDVGKSIDDYKTKHQELQLEISTTSQRIQDLSKKNYLTPDQKKELDDLKGKLGDAKGALSELDTAFEESSKRMLFNMLVTKAAADGLTETEVNNLTLIALHWGLVDQATATTAQQINAIDLSDGALELRTIDDLLTHMNGLPRNYNYDITTTHTDRYFVQHGGTESQEESTSRGQERVGGERLASGGSFSYTIPPGYNENFRVGPYQYAGSGEEVHTTVIPKWKSSKTSGTPLIGTVIINNGMDQAAFERMLMRATR